MTARPATASRPRHAAPSRGTGQAGTPAGRDGSALDRQRSVLSAGTLAAAVVHGTGLAVLTLIALIGFVAAPHAGGGLPAVLRTAAVAWLAGHHVAVALRGAGRIGMLPLGLTLVPGALAWRAGKWVVRVTGARRLRHALYAALALAVPYAVLGGVLAVAGRSASAASSLPQAVGCCFLVALAFGGLGGLRALAPWRQLLALASPRARSVVAGAAGSVAALAAAGAVLAAVSLAVHMGQAVTLTDSLAPGGIGLMLLLLLQAAYLPNAIIWAVAFTLGPGFAVGAGTVVSPTGTQLAQLPAFPLLAALPPGLQHGLPGGAAALVLALPYLAGVLAGVLVVRTGGGPVTGPPASRDGAPARGLAAGVAAGAVLGVLAAVSGGPLGDGRLAAVGPSPWQVGLVAAVQLGLTAAVTAGVVNWIALRRAGVLAVADTADYVPAAAAGAEADLAPDDLAPDDPVPDDPVPDDIAPEPAEVAAEVTADNVIYLQKRAGGAPVPSQRAPAKDS